MASNRTEAVVITTGAVLVGGLIVYEGMSLRQTASFLGVVAFSGLVGRLIPYWVMMTTLERVLAVLLGATLVFDALDSYWLYRLNTPDSGVTWFIIAHRALALLAVVSWPWWVGSIGTSKQRLARGYIHRSHNSERGQVS